MIISLVGCHALVCKRVGGLVRGKELHPQEGDHQQSPALAPEDQHRQAQPALF